ncbi:MAG: Asp-tRNA(Asn)/Glu-tRNA(Gln) amidotransferase subunit GatC [Candidatus Wildermuthbacteria bacterium]|nr:Asp-tRNA(Asn)/Glu-tRNA(Gln) amidotransferase subunit GatC [Candidatus Wildermuthbacteria bacterium]
MITKEQVQHIASLARLKLTEEEIEKFQKDLSSILEYFEVLNSLDAKNAQPLVHVLPLENVTREDTAAEANPELVRELLDMAPSQDQGFLQVKEVFSDEE